MACSGCPGATAALVWLAVPYYRGTVSTPSRRSPLHASRARRRALTSPIALVAALILTLGVAGGALAVGTMPRVESRSPSTGTKDRTPRIVVAVANAKSLHARDVRVTIDGRDASSHVVVQAGQIVVEPGRLADGTHEVRVQTTSIGLLRRQLDERWSFQVDSTAPPLELAEPADAEQARSSVRNTRFRLRTEPGARLTFTSGPSVTRDTADDTGRVTATVRLGEGSNVVRVESRDEVGNSSRETVRVRVDSIPPVAGLVVPKVLRSRELNVTATATDASGVDVEATVDGTAEGISVTRSGRSRFAVTGEDLAEGMHRFTLVVTDGFGHRREVQRVALVDSSEALGENALRRGARGQDVRQLHQELRKLGLFPKAGPAAREFAARRYGPETIAAVRRFQSARGMDVDGIAGDATIAALTLKIVVDRAAHRLTLFQLGKVVKTYSVAVGSSKYPTPAGDFAIQSMQENPTWTPPDSDWAKDAEPIPPGPDNPLGTRWMAIDGTVGIHGTNNPASLGYSVSHGCIRMAIPDVEELFERVTVGTPVSVV